MTLTPRFKEKYARRFMRLVDQLPLRKQAFIQLRAEMRAEGVKVDPSTIYRWVRKFSS